MALIVALWPRLAALINDYRNRGEAGRPNVTIIEVMLDGHPVLLCDNPEPIQKGDQFWVGFEAAALRKQALDQVLHQREQPLMGAIKKFKLEQDAVDRGCPSPKRQRILEPGLGANAENSVALNAVNSDDSSTDVR